MANRLQTDNKLNELIDHFTFLNQQEHLHNLEMEGKNKMPKIIQPPKHAQRDHPGEINKVAIGKRTGESSTCKHILKKFSL